MTLTRRVSHLLLSLLPLSAALIVQVQLPSAEEQYLSANPTDPVAQLLDRIKTGKTKLKFEPTHGYLVSFLHELGISRFSQVLVFSKTSLQSGFISGSTPRAIYFNDTTYVGWIEGAPFMEIASVDPIHGPIFYVLTNSEGPKPAVSRLVYECTQCHDSVMTNHVPGLMARSVFTNYDGTTRLASGSHLTTPKSPLKERWGGWYVTGSHGSDRHMGNEAARGPENNSAIDMERGSNVTNLSRYLDTKSLLEPTSDIVALMVAEHQMAVQNAFTTASFAIRNALRDESIFSPDLAKTGKHSDSTIGRISRACEPVVEALLCSGEGSLQGPISGSADYAGSYLAHYPKDTKGRSLAQFDLIKGLYKYSCSPMIYSTCFTGLPLDAKAKIYRRLREVLMSDAPTKPYAHLTPQVRSDLLAILEGTIPEFASSGKSTR